MTLWHVSGVGALILAIEVALIVGLMRTGSSPLCALGNVPTNGTDECISCHDGTVARDASGHPVDVDYVSLSSMHPDRYSLVELLPQEVRLTGGFLTCRSCHLLESTNPFHAALSGDTLCMSCHLGY